MQKNYLILIKIQHKLLNIDMTHSNTVNRLKKEKKKFYIIFKDSRNLKKWFTVQSLSTGRHNKNLVSKYSLLFCLISVTFK